jgi:hypothetical protein
LPGGYELAGFPRDLERGEEAVSEQAWRRMHPALQDQHDLITPQQARALGVHQQTFRRMVDKGLLEPVEPRVYGPADVPKPWDRRLLAILLSAGDGAVASHRSAARLLAVPTYEGAPIEISVPSKHKFTHQTAVVHESRDLAWVPPWSIDRIPCTPPLRLAVDAGAVLGRTAYTTMVRELRRSHGVTWRQLTAIYRLHSRQGRNGCGPLREQLERYYGLQGIPDSTLEQDALDLMIDAGLPMPVAQHTIDVPGTPRFRIDFAYLAERIAIEIDGPHHELPEVEGYDRWRQQILEDLGWEVLRFKEEDLVYRPGFVVREIRRALRDRSV